MGTIKSELEKAVPALTKAAKKKRKKAPQPAPSVLECYAVFCEHLRDVRVKDPLGREVVFRSDNFPYLIKMENFSQARNLWVPASASVVIQALENGTFDEVAHRCDPARSRGLVRIPEVLESPHAIHSNCHPHIPGDFVYVVKVGADTYKLAFIIKNRAKEWVLVTSFYASGNYV